MRQHFALEVGPNALFERYALGVAELRVGFRVAVPVMADLGRLVAFAECCEHNSQLGRGETHVSSAIDFAQVGKKGFAVFVERVTVLRREVREQLANRGLPLFAFRNLREPSLVVLLVARRES